jgi:hypothetical protein
MNKFTSFEFSKLLWHNGCRLETDCKIKNNFGDKEQYYCFDILWDICVKYSKDFFGDKVITTYNIYTDCERASIFFPNNIFRMICLNIPQESIEKYIWDNCKFNPKNKGE